MSYCRCSDESDLYVYGSPEGGITVSFANGKDSVVELLDKHNLNHDGYYFKTKFFTSLFLAALSLAGFKVPERVFKRLKEEIDAENGVWAHCKKCGDTGVVPVMQASYYVDDDGNEYYDGDEFKVGEDVCKCVYDRNSYFNNKDKKNGKV